MTSISALNHVHQNGLFGNYENKNEENLIKISEVKKMLIVQIFQYKNSKIPYDNSLEGLVSKKKDFIGKRSLTKKAFTASDRQKIVGVVPLDKKTSIPEGSYIVKDAKAKLPNPKLGHVSASCWSVEYDNPFSLAIIKDGKNMIGQKLYALSPLKNKTIPVEIVSSHYVDPKGERVRS